MLYAVLIWAPLDTALCFHYGFWGGAIINTSVFIVLMALLFRARADQIICATSGNHSAQYSCFACSALIASSGLVFTNRT